MKQYINIIKEENIITSKEQLIKPFEDGCKSKVDFKVGVEFEKLSAGTENKSVSYCENNGILEFLKRFKQSTNCEFLTEDEQILGLTGCNSDITLEPGAQVEYVTKPEKNIHEINNRIKTYNKISSDIAQELGFKWIGAGVHPVSTNENIKVIPKKRYKMMGKYLPSKGVGGLVMMRESAGIQAAFDYKSEEDATRKLKLTLLLSPFVTAMFANSPIRKGKRNGYKTYRGYGWLHTDNDRCGLISSKIFDNDYDFSFEDYVDILLDIPMIFVKKGNSIIDFTGITFRDYMNKDYKAVMNDWELHCSLYFPDVRLKKYIEIRNCDCQRNDMIMAMPAFWKGILYNQDAIDEVFKMFKDICWKELNQIRVEVPKHALNTDIKSKKLSDYAKELVNISEQSLKSMQQKNDQNQDESIYLQKLQELVKNNVTPADETLKYWNGNWNKDVSKLIEYLRLN